MLILRMYDREREEEAEAEEAKSGEAVAAAPPPAAPAPRRPPAAPPPAVDEAPPARPAREEAELMVFEDEPAAQSTPIDAPSPPRAAAPAAEEELAFEFEDASAEESATQQADIEAELRRFETETDRPAAPLTLPPRDEPSSTAELTLLEDSLTLPPSDSDEDELARQVMEIYLRIEGSNYYDLLGVARDIDDFGLKMTFHTLVKRFHEDKIRGRLDAAMMEKATQVLQALTQAYETLSSPTKRAEYDRRLTGEGGELKERRITTILAAERAFNQGMSALRRHQYREAEEHFAGACELFPEEGEYHAYLGWVRYNNPARPAAERTAVARECIERSLKINPKGDKAYYFLGKILMQHESKEKARQMFALAFRYNSKNEEAKSELRRLQAERERERAGIEAAAEKEKLGAVLRKDIDFDSVKRAVRKLFTK
jgi:curved DNA-binding protein CbpA